MIKRKENKNKRCIVPYTKTQRQLDAARRKKEKEEEDQAAQKRNEKEKKAYGRRKKTEEAKENKQQKIEEAMKKSKEEEENSKHSYRNIVSPQTDRPDKGINDLLDDIIPREDTDVSGSLGAEQKDEEMRYPQRKKKKKDKRKDKKD